MLHADPGRPSFEQPRPYAMEQTLPEPVHSKQSDRGQPRPRLATAAAPHLGWSNSTNANGGGTAGLFRSMLTMRPNCERHAEHFNRAARLEGKGEWAHKAGLHEREKTEHAHDNGAREPTHAGALPRRIWTCQQTGEHGRLTAAYDRLPMQQSKGRRGDCRDTLAATQANAC